MSSMEKSSFIFQWYVLVIMLDTPCRLVAAGGRLATTYVMTVLYSLAREAFTAIWNSVFAAVCRLQFCQYRQDWDYRHTYITKQVYLIVSLSITTTYVLTVCARNHVKGVGSSPTKHAEISEIVGSRHEQDNVDDNDETQKGEELLVITPVVDRELVRHHVSQPLTQRFGLWRLLRD